MSQDLGNGLSENDASLLKKYFSSWPKTSFKKVVQMPSTNDIEAILRSYTHGKLIEALQLAREFTEKFPNHAFGWKALGTIYENTQQFTESLVPLQNAIALDPHDIETKRTLGNSYFGLGNSSKAEACYREVISLAPDHAESYINLGQLLRQQNRFHESVIAFKTAIKIRPDNPDAHNDLGRSLIGCFDLEAAECAFRQATRLKPEFDNAHSNLGNVLHELGRLAEAESAHRNAIRLSPAFADAHSNLGNVLRDMGRMAEAEESCRTAISIKSDFADAYSNLGDILQQQGRMVEAKDNYLKAIRLAPNSAPTHWNFSHLLLTVGDYCEGWKLYEWRWYLNNANRSIKRDYAVPRWWGNTSIVGQTILIYPEQGIGDSIQCARYIPLLVERGAKVILEAPAQLVSVMQTLPCPVTVIASGETSPAFDLHCPIMSLPLAFKTTVETIPLNIPYLFANKERANRWTAKMVTERSLKVGLVWSGGLRLDQPQTWATNRRRNIPLELLAPLNLPGIKFYSLQKGDEAVEQLKALNAFNWPGPPIIDFTDEIKNFADTAALLEHLDLVISVDTSTAHLAAAMGKPVWLLNRFDTCWRWFLERTDSPWYPTVRIFRQPSLGDWETVIKNVSTELSQLIKARPESCRQ